MRTLGRSPRCRIIASFVTTASDFLTFDEFAPVSFDQWRAKVEEGTPWARLSSQVDARSDGALEVPPLLPAGHRRAPTRVLETPWVVGQQYALQDPHAVAAAIATDREYDLGAAWVRLAPSLRARTASAGSGVVLTEGRGADAIIGAVGGAELWVDAGAHGLTTLALVLEARHEPASLRGGVLCDPLGALAEHGALGCSLGDAVADAGRVLARAAVEAPQLRTLLTSGLPYHDAGASTSVELATVVATLIDVTRSLADQGHSPAHSWPKTVLRIAASSDVFVGLAKVRALRWLTRRVMPHLAGPSDDAVPQPYISVRTSWRDRTRNDPWVNMLRATAEVFGAATGGADEVTVLPFSEAVGSPTPDARRWALTTAHMLRDESHLADVSDPGAGSGYVEFLTEQLARRAWTLVQRIEAAGGMASAIEQGIVQAEVQACARARREALATGRAALTGVSIFPQLDERTVEVASDVAPSEVELPGDAVVVRAPAMEARRLAEPFEALRAASDRYRAQHGARPVAQLFTLGTLREHRPRLDFARAAVMVGGFEPQVVSELTEVRDGLVVLVAADDPLAERAPATCAALRNAGARAVWIAASPPAPSEAWGADGFLHRGTQLPDTMAALQRTLEVG